MAPPAPRAAPLHRLAALLAAAALLDGCAGSTAARPARGPIAQPPGATPEQSEEPLALLGGPKVGGLVVGALVVGAIIAVVLVTGQGRAPPDLSQPPGGPLPR